MGDSWAEDVGRFVQWMIRLALVAVVIIPVLIGVIIYLLVTR